MTLIVENQFPAPAAVDVSPSVHPTFSVTTDDQPVDVTVLNVWVDGRQLVINGAPSPGTRIEPNGLGGISVVADPGRRFPDQQDVGVRVVADDTSAGSPIDVSWSFTIADSRGPVLESAEPPPGSIAVISPATLFLTIADPGTGNSPVPTLADFVANPANLQYAPPEIEGGGPGLAANQVSFDAGGGQGFLGREGRLIEVNSGPDAGQRRRIASVQGPGLATYDGLQLLGPAESLTVFSDLGVDIVVDGVRVIHAGFPDVDAANDGWVGLVNLVPPRVEVLITPPAPWASGDQVPVGIRAPDSSGQVSDINYFFDVGDQRGPQITNVLPEEGTRGIAISPTPASDIQFDVIAINGVDLSTLDIEVNGTAAVTAGSGVGDWSGSTVTGITNGQRVVLKRSTPYVDGDIAFTDIQVSDSLGNVGERRILRHHFGDSTGDSTLTTGLAGTDVVRVIAYDLNETSFARPTELNHNGFAWDGFWYVNGNRGTQVASWFTELGAFPLAGNVVVTADNGWAILRPQDAGAWMTCFPIASPSWSMADNDTLNDADFGPDAVLAIAGSNVLVIDFTADNVTRYNSAGRTLGLGDITGRNSDQSGGAADSLWAIPLGPYQSLAASVGQQDLVMAIGSTGELTVVQEIGPELSTVLRGREATNDVPPRVVTRPTPGTWARLRLGPMTDAENLTALVIAYNDTGQGQIELWDWFQFILTNPSSLAFFDDASSPALTAAEIRDLDISHTPRRLAMAALMVGELKVLDWDIDGLAATAQTFSEVDLGLDGVASAETSAVALEPGFVADHGHIYAAVSAPADGRVTRFRVHSPGAPDRALELASGQPFSTISPVGKRRVANRFVNTSMNVV
jgi:hypothetical protein